jgi:hypothetical protein
VVDADAVIGPIVRIQLCGHPKSIMHKLENSGPEPTAPHISKSIMHKLQRGTGHRADHRVRSVHLELPAVTRTLAISA